MSASPSSPAIDLSAGVPAEMRGGKMRRACPILCALLLTAAAGAAPGPSLVRRGEATELVVAGKPFLILGGELGNSTASDRAALAPLWPEFRALGLNTVLAPVSWERIEPEERKFDFASVDALIEDARASDLHLVLLWFGAWKNSMSSYVPAWVKCDSRRFPRVHDPEGKAIEMLSAFDPNARQADARAFAALMTHLKAVDSQRRTVLMVQVENEVGMLGAAREHGPAADAAFAAPVPRALVDRLASATAESPARALWQANGARRAGSWRTLFGDGDKAEEIFTAWHFARYVESVAAAGKAVYPLPLYVNAALARPGKRPGDYPAGGPLPPLLEIWRAGAPSIDLIAPDIYFPNFREIAAAYGRPLFVPEAERAGDPRFGADAWLAAGAFGAIGFSPFAIDTVAGSEAAASLGRTYRLLASIAPILLDARRLGEVAGFAAPVSFDGRVDETPQSAVLGDYRFTVSFVDPWTPRADQRIDAHGGLIIRTGPEDYLVAGEGLVVTVAPADPAAGSAGIDRDEQGRYIDGSWHEDRRLNGDETHQGRHIRLPPGAPSLQRVRLYRYR
jgi:beta-galactosidase GanA